MCVAVLLLEKRNVAHCHMSLQLWSEDSDYEIQLTFQYTVTYLQSIHLLLTL